MENVVDMTKAVLNEVEQKEGGHDLEKVKEYVERLFNLEAEIIELREQRKDLKDDFKKAIDLKLVGNVVRLVKAKLAITTKMEVSSDTVEEVEEIVVDKINKIM